VSEAIESARVGADIVFLDIFYHEFPNKQDWHEDALLGAYLPRIMNESELTSALDLVRNKNPEAILTGNLGLLPVYAEFSVPTFLDYSLIPSTTSTSCFFRKYNATPLISPELSLTS